MAFGVLLVVAVGLVMDEGKGDLFEQFGLVLLQAQEIVGLALLDQCCDLFLATHGIDAHHPFNSSISSNAGMAVISLVLPSTCSCPSTSWFWWLHALIMWMASLPSSRS